MFSGDRSKKDRPCYYSHSSDTRNNWQACILLGSIGGDLIQHEWDGYGVSQSRKPIEQKYNE